MKQKIDFTLLRALFRKQHQERLSAFKKNFDFVGFVMRIVLYGALIAVLSVFLARFADMYLEHSISDTNLVLVTNGLSAWLDCTIRLQ